MVTVQGVLMHCWWEAVQCLGQRDIPRWEALDHEVVGQLLFKSTLQFSLCVAILEHVVQLNSELLEHLQLEVLVF